MKTPKLSLPWCVLALSATLLLASCAGTVEPPLEPQNTSPTQVRLYLGDAGNSFLATNAGQRERLAQSCDLGFTGDSSPGSLLTITATGKGAKVCYSAGSRHLGVFSKEEGSGKKFAVNPGETLSIGLGSDANLRGVRATAASLSVQQTTVDTLFEVEFYDGATRVGKRQLSPTGSGTAPKVFSLSVGGKPFTRLVLKPVRASFRLQGGRNVVSFALTAPGSDVRDTYVGVLTYTGRTAFSTSEPWSGQSCSGHSLSGTRTNSGHINDTVTATIIFDGYNWVGGIELTARSVRSGRYDYETGGVARTPISYSTSSMTRTAGKPELGSTRSISINNDGWAGGWVDVQYPESLMHWTSYSENCQGGTSQSGSYPRRDNRQQLAVSSGRYDQNGAFVGEIVQRSDTHVDRWTWSIWRQ